MPFENPLSAHMHDSVRAALPGEAESQIALRAEQRRRQQELQVGLLNTKILGSTESMKNFDQQLRSRIGREANAEWPCTNFTPDDLLAKAAEMQSEAEIQSENADPLATTNFAQVAKLRLLAGADVSLDLAITQEQLKNRNTGSMRTTADLMPDAILLGIQKKLLEAGVLPTHEQVAEALNPYRRQLLTDYALVLPEAERAQFISLLPANQQKQVSALMDDAVSRVLHGSLVAKDSEDEKQRRTVRTRVYNDLRMVVEDAQATDAVAGAALARAMFHLGDDVKNLLLDLAREEVERQRNGVQRGANAGYLPHLMGVFLKQFEDWRGNDLALQIVGDAHFPDGFRFSLLQKIVKNKYLEAGVGEWVLGAREKSVRQEKLSVLAAVVSELGVVPSQAVLEFVGTAQKWREAPLAERIRQIKDSQKEFAAATTHLDLVKMLANDEHRAMMYYLLHGGEDRFNLINNYSFEKFKEMLGLISQLRRHEQPEREFLAAVQKGGVPPAAAKNILERLRAGNFYATDTALAYQEVSFDVSEQAAMRNANAEIGRVLGREQLAITLLAPLYREFLADESAAASWIEKLNSAHTFAERRMVLDEMEGYFPEFRARAKKELEDNWRSLGEKMVLELSLDQVFGDDSVPVKGEEIIPKLNAKRVDLKKMKKDLLVALRGENKQMTDLRNNISKKRAARRGLVEAVEKIKDSAKQQSLTEKIAAIDQQIADLEVKKSVLGNEKVMERFADLSAVEREAEIEKLGKEIVALTEKSPSAIFTYLTMQVVGEERLTEQDVQLVQEMESHLQGPFQTIVDAQTYEPRRREEKKRRRLGMAYLDKRNRFMSMLRFADSKICCFSSCNYEMRVQHDTPNKYWVASINADPMSFVIALESPHEAGDDPARAAVHENEGFIFGSFAVDAQGELAIMLNGLYYAPGIEDDKQTAAMMDGVEKMFGGLPIKTVALAGQYGGAVKMPVGYKQENIILRRLRALDDGQGRPETKVYDDLESGSDLNQAHNYTLWVKHL